MKKKHLVYIITGVILFIILSIMLMLINNSTYNSFSTSLFEKKWLNDHKNELQDVNVFDNVPVFSEEGKGVVFDFLKGLKKETGLEYNTIAYQSPADFKEPGFKIVGLNQEVAEKELVFYNDNYVMISNNNKVINSFNDFSNKKVGVLASDKDVINSYINTNVNYVGVANYESLVSSLKNKSVDFIILPHNVALQNTLKLDNYFVNYHFGNLSLKYVFSTAKMDKELASIVKKYYRYYLKNKLDKAVSKARFDTYIKIKQITDQEKADLLSKTYTYNYLNELPYADKVSTENIGVINDYMSDFAKFSGVSIKYQKANTKEGLAKNSDIYYDSDVKLKENELMTSSVMSNLYQVVIHNKSLEVIDGIKSLDYKKVYVLANSPVENYLKNNTKAIVIAEKNTNSLLKNNAEKDIMVIDSLIYDYQKMNKLNNMRVAYSFDVSTNSGFVINNKDDLLHDMFNYYLLGINYNQNNNVNINYLVSNPMKQSIYSAIAKYILFLIIIVVISFVAIINVIKRKREDVKAEKHEKLKYVDQLTSLKNRNYLNDNIDLWDENNIYPQTIMVVDLNNIKYINDNFGHEAGDEVIKKAASILINNQKENSDIIRIDGNEFLLYLVGYPENEIVSYMRKLFKELKTLPYDFGGAVGYSMIENDVKSIDDAINEATLDMRVNKETSQKS